MQDRNRTELDLLSLLPAEISLLIMESLTVRDLALLASVSQYGRLLAEQGIIWKKHCLDFSPIAVRYVRDLRPHETWKETYHRLIETNRQTITVLQDYYWQAHQRHHPSAEDVSIPDQGIEWAILCEANLAHGWHLEKMPEKITGYETDYANHHCQLFAAAACGHTALLHRLLDKKAPLIEDIFNFEHTDRLLTVTFPAPIRLVRTSGFPVDEPCLIDFARFYDQQCLLDRYYQIALTLAPKDEWLYFAILCRQPQNIIVSLIKDNKDINIVKRLAMKTSFLNWHTPLHMAVCCGDLDIVTLLLQNGVDLKDDSYFDITTIAALHKQKDILSLLMEAGAVTELSHEALIAGIDGTIPNDMTSIEQALVLAWQIALRHGHAELLKVISDYQLPLFDEWLTDNDFFVAALRGHQAILDFMLTSSRWHHHDSDKLSLLIRYAVYFHNTDRLAKALDGDLSVPTKHRQRLLNQLENYTNPNNPEIIEKIRLLLQRKCDTKLSFFVKDKSPCQATSTLEKKFECRLS